MIFYIFVACGFGDRGVKRGALALFIFPLTEFLRDVY